jgi:hypothetical protein
MIVKLRFGQGRLLTRRKGKNGRIALLLASLLTLVTISFAVLGLWRIGEDLGFAGDFVFPEGMFSHWQVWIAAAAASQYVCWRLTRYSQLAGREADEIADAEAEEAVVPKATAGV